MNLSSLSNVSDREYAAEHVCTTAARTTFFADMVGRTCLARRVSRGVVFEGSGIGVSDEPVGCTQDHMTSELQESWRNTMLNKRRYDKISTPG